MERTAKLVYLFAGAREEIPEENENNLGKEEAEHLSSEVTGCYASCGG